MPNRPNYHRCDRPQPRREGKKPYGRKGWQIVRRRVLAAEPMCPCGRPATEVDHIDGNPRNNSRENLQPYCKSCHSKKTVREDGGLRGKQCESE